MNPLEPGQLWLMRISAWIGAGVVLLVALIAEVINRRLDLIPSNLILPIIAILLIYPAFVAPGRLFRAWRWKVEAEELHLHHGVWTKLETVVPFRRVQHIDVAQNALQRTFGVTSLVMHTAGTAHSRVVLPGLARETAEALRDQARTVIAREADEF